MYERTTMKQAARLLTSSAQLGGILRMEGQRVNDKMNMTKTERRRHRNKSINSISPMGRSRSWIWSLSVLMVFQVLLYPMSSAATEVVSNVKFQEVCELWGNPVFELISQNETGTVLRLVNTTNEDEPNRLRGRRLHNRHMASFAGWRENNISWVKNNEEDITAISFRECHCVQRRPQGQISEKEIKLTHYCPLATDRCGIPFPNDSNQDPICFTAPIGVSLVRGIVIFALLTLILILFFTCFTAKGKSALDFALGQCQPRRNHRIADSLLQHDSERARQMIRQHVEREHIIQERRRQLRQRQHGGPVPSNQRHDGDRDAVTTRSASRPSVIMSLELRTQIFERIEQSEDGDEEDVLCCICFGELETNDRIGALKCKHKFHVDCLKGWLKRRNVCPLCQEEKIAEEKFSSSSEPSKSSSQSALSVSEIMDDYSNEEEE